jgi:F-type H+-transporting ATPase subunit delta
MTNRTAAARYARALFEVSVQDRDLQQVESDLARSLALIDGHETLRRVLLNPAIPTPRKHAIMTDLVTRLGDLLPPVPKLLTLLAERDRLGILADILEAYSARLMDHLGVVQATVTTAHALPAERTATIERSLAHASGRQVILTAEVDPALLGGLVAKVGSTVYDASVARNLERIRQTLWER